VRPDRVVTSRRFSSWLFEAIVTAGGGRRNAAAAASIIE
jgi:hypothetical protein